MAGSIGEFEEKVYGLSVDGASNLKKGEAATVSTLTATGASDLVGAVHAESTLQVDGVQDFHAAGILPNAAAGAAVIGKINATGGPASTAQVGWVSIKVAGVASWVPYWQ